MLYFMFHFAPHLIRLGVLGLLLVSGVLLAAQLPRELPVPGGIAIIPLPAKATFATFQEKPVWVARQDNRFFAIVGIALNQPPGVAKLQIGEQNIQFQVHPHEYEESRIYLENQQYVTPNKETLKRIQSERREIQAQFRVFTDRVPETPFLLPVAGPWSSRFGLQRFFNDQPRKPHSGLDVAAPQGTLVRSPAAGKVLMSGHYYFNGKTIFIDHGQGLVTMYCHLNEIRSQPGDDLVQGDIIGTVGKTGRVTGAHLHWSVNLGGTMVNPELLLATPAEQ